MRHDLSGTKESPHQCADATEIVYRFLAVTLQQPPAAIFPLDLFASIHAHVDSWDH